jgi:hypothetical protein
MTTRIILYRDRIAGKWLAAYPDGVTIDTSFVSAAKAGDVARIIARTNPGSQIGVKSSDARAW